MTPERWQQVKTVLDGALELAPLQRPAFLDQACCADHSLRQDVESLLESADGARSGFLPSSAVRITLTKGTRLGDYEVQSQIGAGGMGEVYRARDRRLDRDVAIKVLPSFLSSDSDRLRRFEQEARAAAALNHPNILAVHQMGIHEGAPYLVSELLDGLTLREHLRRGPPPVRKAIDCAIQIAHGLAAAHDKGVVHRDLKPENLFVTKDGRIKILDFGLAKLTQPAPNPAEVTGGIDKQSEPGVVLGTVGYMSPEQVRGEAADHRADIFAFGTILYEMLSGKRAFQGATAVETMGAILKDDAPSLAEIAPAIPPALPRIVHRCLEKSPPQRFHSAWDLAFALESLSEAAASPLVFGQRAKRRVQAGWFLAALLLVALAAFGIAYFRRSPRPEPAMHLSMTLPSSVRDLALSPDGHTLAFIAPLANGGGNVLWIREIGSTEMRALGNTEGASYPFWSPDARSIGFFADGKLKRIEASGGLVQVLCDAPFGRGGTWNREATIVFAPNPSWGLQRVSATGGTPTPATEISPGSPNFANLSHRWPSFLPDGKHFLYSMADFTGLQGSANAIYVGALGSKEQRRLLASNSNAAYLPPGYIVFARNRTLMAQRFDPDRLQLEGEPFAVVDDVDYVNIVARALFSVSPNGTLVYQTGSSTSSQLQWFDRSGKRLSTIGAPARYANPRISPDGRKVAVDIDDSESNTDIWLINLENGVRSRFTFDVAAATDETPIWSPDGAKVLWISQRNGGIDFYVKGTAGSGSEEPIPRSSITQLDLPTDWSRDGHFLLYTAPRSDWTLQMRILSMSGERESRPFAHSQSSEREGQFSPDGHWVAYTSNESARSQIYVVPFPGPGGKYQLSTEGGQQPRWKRDGKELFFLSPDKKLMAASVKAGAPFESGQPTVLFQTRAREPLSAEEIFTYDVSQDGQRFLINVNLEQSNPPPVSIVLNWTTELAK
jgi:serine/threonine protein kinase/Tol biopolymer transport system component